MKEHVDKYIFYVCLAFSLCMFIGGFFCPPMGVMKTGGILLGFDIVLLTMLIGFLLAYYLRWGWLLTIAVTAIGGISIRKIVINKIDDTLK